MKKLFAKLFSYRTWTYAAAVVTVLMAIPVLKECVKSEPEIDVTVGQFLITGQKEITLLYVIPDAELDKFRVPFALSFINEEKYAIHNFLARFSTKMLKINSAEGKEGYMKRFLCINENMNNHIQNIYVKSTTMVGRGRIDLSSNEYELNLVRRDQVQTPNTPFDSFDFNLEITYDDQEKAQNIHFNVLGMFESQYEEMLQNRMEINKELVFAIHTETEYYTKQEDGIKIMKCKLKETGSVARL